MIQEVKQESRQMFTHCFCDSFMVHARSGTTIFAVMHHLAEGVTSFTVKKIEYCHYWLLCRLSRDVKNLMNMFQYIIWMSMCVFPMALQAPSPHCLGTICLPGQQFYNISISLWFHTDLQDRKCVSPEWIKTVEPGRKQHHQTGKLAGPGLFDWTQPTTQLHLCGGEHPLSRWWHL